MLNMKLNVFWQNFLKLEICWISEAVHGLASGLNICCVEEKAFPRKAQFFDFLKTQKYFILRMLIIALMIPYF